jgi:hypothetical protein
VICCCAVPVRGDTNRGGRGGDRQVQPEEVNEFLAPAIKLASEYKDKTVTIHFFSYTGADGKASPNEGTYKVYDPASKTYLKSVTVTFPQASDDKKSIKKE